MRYPTFTSTSYRSRRPALTAAGLALALVAALPLSACGSAAESTDSAGTTSATDTVGADSDTNASAAAPALPPTERAQGDKNGELGQCPYLDNEWVADTNGQRNVHWSIDTRFDPPACLWWSYQDSPHIEVLVRTLDGDQAALDMIDAAVTHPGTTTEVTINPGDPDAAVEAADKPEGWSGYRASKADASVYAVRKGTTVVVVHSNQAQTIKPQTIALKVIENLQL